MPAPRSLLFRLVAAAIAPVAAVACDVPATRFTGPGDDGGMITPTLDASATSYDFGTVVTSTQTAPTMFVFSNTHGAATPALLPATITGPGAVLFALGVDGCAGRTLAPGESCAVAAMMAPSSEGAAHAALGVTTEQGGGATIELSGTAVSAGALKLSPLTAMYDPLSPGAVSPDAAFTATNSGGSPTGTIIVGLSGSDAGQFAVASDSCSGKSLAPHTTCTIKARFAPHSSGSKAASLTVTSAAAGTGVATLGGHGLLPAALAIAPPANDFGPIVIGGVSATATFTIRNTGELPSGTATASLPSDTGQFQITGDTCTGQALAAGASCTLSVAFAPTGTGIKPAQLAVATSDGTATAALTGTGIPPAALAFTPASNNYGTIDVGAAAQATFTLTNNGGQASSAIATSLLGTSASELAITGDGCTDHTLAAGASCSIAVSFVPTSFGSKSATLQATAGVGGTTTASLSGTARDKVTLTVLTNGGNGTGSVACNQAACAAQYYRGTPITLTATPDPNMRFGRWTGACFGTTPSCDVTLAGNTTVTAAFLPATQDLMIATSGVAGATGTIATSPAGTPCGTGCLRFDTGTIVTLTATPTVGFYLAAWTGDCVGNGLACQLTMTAGHSAAAQFSPANRAFLTSGTSWPDATNPDAWADATCQATARAAGLPGTYVGWLGSSTLASWTQRLGNASGWVRVDGKPFAATRNDVLIAGTYNTTTRTLYPLTVDEHGASVSPNSYVLAGLLGGNCNGWTLTSGQFYAGQAGGSWWGPGTYDPYSGGSTLACGTKLPMYCLGTDYNVNLSYPRATGRTAFVTGGPPGNPGGIAGLDAWCTTRAAASGLVGTFKALVSSTTASAASRFSTSGAPWVRPDGIAIVATAADLFASGGPVMTAALDIQLGGFTYTGGAGTTGGTSLTAPTTAQLNCNDFTDTTSQFSWLTDLPGYTNHLMVAIGTSGGFPCNVNLGAIYCLED